MVAALEYVNKKVLTVAHKAESGFPPTCSMVVKFAWAIALHSGKGSLFNPELGPGEQWWSGFRKCHTQS